MCELDDEFREVEIDLKIHVQILGALFTEIEKTEIEELKNNAEQEQANINLSPSP